VTRCIILPVTPNLTKTSVIQSLNGIKTEDEINDEERPLKALQCGRCHEINSSTNRFCSKCGSPLDVRTALEVQKEQETTDQIMNKLFENTKFRNAVEQALRVLK